MSIYNTPADAANTAVRAFLTKIGEYFLGRSFNTGSGSSKNDWIKIKDEVFNGMCAYCGKSDVKLQMDHLIMFNREQFGLHHPGNIVPACKICNKRIENSDNQYVSWEDQLSYICEQNNDTNNFLIRWKKIKYHMNESEYKYPTLSPEEYKMLKLITNNLYNGVKKEFEESINLYKELDESFTRK